MLTCFSAFIFRFCHPFNIIVWIILFCCCWWCWQWWCWWWFRNFKGKNRTKQNIKRSGEMFTKSFYSSSLCHFAYSESRLLLSHVYAFDVYRCIARVQCTRIISMYGLVYTNLWMFCGSVTNTCIKIWCDEMRRVESACPWTVPIGRSKHTLTPHTAPFYKIIAKQSTCVLKQ